MQKEMSKGRMILFLAALFLTNVGVMADMVIVPAIGSFFEVFGAQVNLVNFIISGPVLISVISALACGKLVQYFSKKTLLTFGFALFTVGAIFGVVIESAFYIAAMRSLVGVGIGFINVTAMSLIAEVYTNENKRSAMMGAFNGSMAGVGAVIGLIAGYFAADSWQSVFKVYWIGVPILIMVVLFVPKTPPEKQNVDENKKAIKKDPIPLKTFGSLCISMFIWNAMYGVIFFQIAVYVLENSIGNESLVGILSSLGTIGSLCACLLFGVTYSKLGRGSIIPSYIILALGYLILLITQNAIIVGVVCTIMGAAYGNGFSYFYMRATVVVPPSQISNSIGIITAVNGVSFFISTYLVTYLQGIIGVDTLTGTMPVYISVLAIGSVASVLLTIRNKKYPSEYQALNIKGSAIVEE
ncbi:MFS transporter [Alkalibaculum sp. M08DMB]|uniref:MFS transporter n=1 Tax=Alkalibaculum sporogenes TaxID=2655001 RepID=A0A6A7KBL8_9FIRM|nr:MFS transporter [Alkalibaculum sporogenes]MPW26804.1 MFS transporter [Alkalibaculum sporogenes]